jgi:hypothetical protein
MCDGTYGQRIASRCPRLIWHRTCVLALAVALAPAFPLLPEGRTVSDSAIDGPSDYKHVTQPD